MTSCASVITQRRQGEFGVERMWIENLSEEIEHMSGSLHATCFSSKPDIDLQDRSKHKSLQREIRLLVHASIKNACSVKLAASKTMARMGQRKPPKQRLAFITCFKSFHNRAEISSQQDPSKHRVLANLGHVWCKHGEWDSLETPLVWRALQICPQMLAAQYETR